MKQVTIKKKSTNEVLVFKSISDLKRAIGLVDNTAYILFSHGVAVEGCDDYEFVKIEELHITADRNAYIRSRRAKRNL